MNTTHKKGFTIIEVVLVLAIAALIFLMIFIALPALQRNQRDTQRRTDVGTFISQLQNYQTNNNGKIPSSSDQLTTFKSNYLKWKSDGSGEFNDPKTGTGYTITLTDEMPKDGEMFYQSDAKCDGENLDSDAGVRSGAVRVKLEGSGVFCQDNQ